MRPLVAEARYTPRGASRVPPPVTSGAGRGPAPAGMRRDPAPTRLAYRMQRLWLTPLFRVGVRLGLPVFLVVFALMLWLGDDARRAAIVAQIDGWKQDIQNRPEFRVNVLQIEGASPALDAAVREMLALKLPVSSFAVDLEAIRARVALLDAVESVTVRVGGSGALEIDITERVPALVWRRSDALDLLDASGRRVAQIPTRADRPDLPLIAGEGAGTVAAEALRLIAAAGPLQPRIRGLVRVGVRRWDIVLDRDQRVLLPPHDPVRALERLLALDKAEDLLNRDVLAVDLRNQLRPTLRLAPNALREMRRARGIEPVETPL